MDRPSPEIVLPKSPALWIDATLPTLEENLALDEVLLAEVDQAPSQPVIRTWRPDRYAVILGRSNRAETEADVERCRALQIPILRRSSGGGTVLIGPGCLAYSVILPIDDSLRTAGVVGVTRAVMQRFADHLAQRVPDVVVRGTSDLVVNDRKFSGNSQRWLKHALLHHGTVLHHFDLNRIPEFLRPPSREPEYRAGRPHLDFITNVPLPEATWIQTLSEAWSAVPAGLSDPQRDASASLAASRYRQETWNFDR